MRAGIPKVILLGEEEDLFTNRLETGRKTGTGTEGRSSLDPLTMEYQGQLLVPRKRIRFSVPKMAYDAKNRSLNTQNGTDLAGPL